MCPGERFNAWTHLFGALFALTGAVWLIVIAAASGDPLKTVSVTIYGLTLVTLYRNNRGQDHSFTDFAAQRR